MHVTDHDTFLRTVLRIDAVTCVAMGLLTTLGSEVVAGLTGLPRALLVSSGLALLPIAAFMALVAARRPVWATGAWLVVAGNIGWVAGSLLLLATDAAAPNAFGTVFVVAQAATVALLATLEVIGLRQPRQLA